MPELTEREKRMLALAIQGLCMRQGPSVWPDAIALADKLEVKECLKEYLEGYIRWAAPIIKDDAADNLMAEVSAKR